VAAATEAAATEATAVAVTGVDTAAVAMEPDTALAAAVAATGAAAAVVDTAAAADTRPTINHSPRLLVLYNRASLRFTTVPISSSEPLVFKGTLASSFCGDLRNLY
jgi:hypothetical protein